LCAGAFVWLVGAPSVAIAGCAPGETPSYADVDGITVHRYRLVGNWPRFDAHFTLHYNYFKHDWVFDATLDAQLGLPIAGKFSESSAQTFEVLRALLQAHDFYALRLTPGPALYLDAPEDFVSVTRCGVTTTLGFDFVPEFYIPDNGQLKALGALLDDLQSAILQLPWTPSPSPSPSP
jgi:hypothetical protein